MPAPAPEIMADSERAYVSSFFSEDPDYFTLHCRQDDELTIVASEPLTNTVEWKPMPNGAIIEIA